jgi:DNA invertase Pin-like site-specific DNA recombinase
MNIQNIYPPRKAFSYLRVSGKGQVDGDGFDRQLLACQTYAATEGIEIVEVFKEEGVSGTKELDDRPALSELFAALEENGIKTVIVEKLDRLARDLMVQETIIADMRKAGYTLLSTCEPDLCSTDPSRILVRQIFGAISQYEKSMIVLKLRGARQRMKAKMGRCEGKKSYGHYPGEDAILQAIRGLCMGGMRSDGIAQHLNEEGNFTRSGKPWSGSTIRKILKNEASRENI